MATKNRKFFHKKLTAIYIVLTIIFIAVICYSLFVIFLRPIAEDRLGALLPLVTGISFAVCLIVYILLTVFAARGLRKNIINPIQNVANVIDDLAAGNLDTRIEYRVNDAFSALTKKLDDIIAGVKYEADILTKISQGDYTARLQPRGSGDKLVTAISTLIERQQTLVGDLKIISNQISVASQEIALGSQSLATGSDEQSSAIEEFSVTINSLRDKTERNAKDVQDIIESMRQYTSIVRGIGADMQKMTQTMSDINESARQISSVSDVIESIAFQTNILALNAAVEAARAGVHGKGFAVVADEVRQLSSKSAEAARETAALIKTDLENVDIGTRIAQGAAREIAEIEKITAGNEQRMTQLGLASVEQSEEVNEININIGQISTIVQANSALAEQSAASATQLESQAKQLYQLIGHIKV